jgi:hypothetical protein
VTTPVLVIRHHGDAKRRRVAAAATVGAIIRRDYAAIQAKIAIKCAVPALAGITDVLDAIPYCCWDSSTDTIEIMFHPVPFLRFALALVLLLAQVSGGFARVVHCYDSHCELVGMNWECHVDCDGNHGAVEQSCDHQHDGNVKKGGPDDCKNPNGEAFGTPIGSKPCGNNHHHHYVAAVELICMQAENSVEDHLLGLCDVAFLAPVLGLLPLPALSSRLEFGRGIGFHPAIPLVLRLRI